MSLRSMNCSKVDSMVALSVLLSTTRKFFFESGAAVTCYTGASDVGSLLLLELARLTPMPARSKPVTESW